MISCKSKLTLIYREVEYLPLLIDSSINYSFNKDVEDSQAMSVPLVIPPISLQLEELELQGNNIFVVNRTIGNANVV